MLALLGLFADQNDSFAKRLIYLKPVKGTPFGQSILILAIVGSTPGLYTVIGHF